MKNPFEDHGIDHLSASSLNLFAAEPALWVLEKLLKQSAPVGCAAHRGSAVEAGLNYHIRRSETDDGVTPSDIARARYAALTAFTRDPRREEARDDIHPMVEKACGYWDMLFPDLDVDYQVKVVRELDGIEVPFVGFIDYLVDDRIVVDLKTSGRMNSEVSPAHARQVSIYTYGTNHSAHVLYVTPKKAMLYDVHDTVMHVHAVKQIAARLRRFLAISSDPHELAAIVCPNYESFYWNEPTARALGLQAFGF